MPVYILLIVLFLHNGPVLSDNTVAPSKEDCVSNLPLIIKSYQDVAKINLGGKVFTIEDVEGSCIMVKESI